jgi:hypothetical protein
LEGTAFIENCRAALDMSLTKTGINHYYVGGLVGQSVSTGTVRDISSQGTLLISATYVAWNTSIGGIAGNVSWTSFDNCVFGGKITVPPGYEGAEYLFLGGLIGDFSCVNEDLNIDLEPELSDSRATGSLSYRGTSSGLIYVGGAVGRLQGNRSKLKNWKITDCEYSGGAITVESGSTTTSTNFLYVGGFIGAIMYCGKVSKSYSRAEGVTASKTNNTSYGTTHVGGFAGELSQSEVSGCGSTSPVNVPESNRAEVTVCIGGFSGYIVTQQGISTKIENCYAFGAVQVLGGGTIYAGGLIGWANRLNNWGQIEITGSYATGPVTAANAGFDLCVGGLVGYALDTNINNCYATGFVSADNRAGNKKVYAGGLVGRFKSSTFDSSPPTSYPSSFEVKNNIARGSVNARSAGEVYAGGMVGYWDINYSASLSKNVALGVSVIATGGSSRYAQRVYAYPTANIGANNYAFHTMKIGTGAYGTYVTSSNAPGTSVGSTYPNGLNVNMGNSGGSGSGSSPNTNTANFWTNTRDSPPQNIYALDFSTVKWKYTDIGDRLFPRLIWE